MAVERLKESKKLVVVESVPHKVLVSGQPVSVGKRLWCCGHGGLVCAMVVQTDTKKRQCVLYNVESNERLVREERDMNNVPRHDNYSRHTDEFWAVAAHEAISRYTLHQRYRLGAKLKWNKKQMSKATAELKKSQREFSRIGPLRQAAFRKIAGLKKAFSRIEQAMKK